MRLAVGRGPEPRLEWSAPSQRRSGARPRALCGARSCAVRTPAGAGEEARAGSIAGEATSIFKLFGASLAQDRQELVARLMGSQGYGWEGQAFSEDELGATRSWLSSKAVTIYGGTNEVQMNIIAKRVLGLPD